MAANPSGFNIFDMFRSAPPAAPAAGAQQNNGTAPPGASGAGGSPTPGTADPNNPLLPAGGPGSTQDPNANKSPMADFADLWKNDTKPGDQPAIDWNDPLSIVPDIKIDPAKVMEAAKKVDFSRALNPETVKKALAGDVQAFGEVINSVAQASFANSAMMSSRMMDNAMRRMAPRLFENALPHHLRRHGVNEGLAAENPIFNDPAVAPMLESVKAQLTLKHPQASIKEITDMAKKYVGDFAKAVSGKGSGGPGSDLLGPGKGGGGNPASGEIDWMKDFLEEAAPKQ